MTSRRGFLAFRDVSKRFRRGERADSLRDVFATAASRLLGRGRTDDEQAFWALRGVSFEATPGRILGIIGSNGAGKSTVLKLGLGIMQPTSGTVETRGRVGALIEIAAGFHPDLTGRENVFLQGAVMGMKRAEVLRRFDEIVDFAGIGDFIDTPVKRYSSGMSARLGFAIAAHTEPDVLLIDEVLAVGDLAFQQKALARLAEIVERDIPVVLISHQLDRLLALCDEALLLERGHIVAHGEPDEVIARYVGGSAPPGGGDPAGWIEIDSGTLSPTGILATGSTLEFEVRGECDRPDLEFGVWFRSMPDGTALYSAASSSCGLTLPSAGAFRTRIRLHMHVGSGAYGLQPCLVDRRDRQPRARGAILAVQVQREGHAFGRVDLAVQMEHLDP